MLVSICLWFLLIQVQEIPYLKELIVELQQKIENLEAVNNIKTDHEKWDFNQK